MYKKMKYIYKSVQKSIKNENLSKFVNPYI